MCVVEAAPVSAEREALERSEAAGFGGGAGSAGGACWCGGEGAGRPGTSGMFALPWVSEWASKCVWRAGSVSKGVRADRLRWMSELASSSWHPHSCVFPGAAVVCGWCGHFVKLHFVRGTWLSTFFSLLPLFSRFPL